MEYPESKIEFTPFPLIGRRRELSELDRALGNLTSGRGGIFVIEGEPGIGKSRLAAEFAMRAHQRNVRVAWAACAAGGESAPPLWPWIQIAHRLARRDGIDLDEEETGSESRFETAVPTLAKAALERQGARQLPLAQISRAAIALLADAAGAKPLALIFEDAEQTDAPSLELIAAAAAELREVLIVISCCAVALRQSSALQKAFAGPAFGSARWIQLKGLDGDDLIRLVEARARFTPDADALHAIQRMSGGNPEFVGMLADSSLAWGSHDSWKCVRLTPRVRIGIERYLRPFPEEVRSVLRIAATIGPEFESRVLNEVCADSRGEAAEIIEEAEAAGIIRPLHDRPGRHVFTHTLVWQALREETPRRESARLHRRIAHSLLSAHACEKEYLGEIAIHFNHSAADGGNPEAARHCERAAEYAEETRDFAAAARFYRMALASLDADGDGAAERRCDLLLALGRTEIRAGNAGEGSRNLTCAAELAELSRDPARFARAALALAGGVWHIALGGRDAPHIRSLLEKSLRMLGDAATPEAAMVSARLAAELYSRRENPERQRMLSRRADTTARDVNDPKALLSALHQRHLSLLPDCGRNGEGLRNADEMLATASTLGDDEQWCLAFALRQAELLRQGDLMRADVGAAALSNAARGAGGRVYAETLAAWTATRAFIDGRFEEALPGAWRFLEATRKVFPEAVALFLPGAVTMLREVGRLDEVEPLAARCAEAYPWLIVSRVALAQIRLARGDIESARMMLRAQLAQGFADLTDNLFLPAYAAALAELTVELGDSAHADELYDVLLPHEPCNIVPGPFAFAGPAARYLGMLAATRGKFEDAEKHFRKALLLSSRTAARPWIAYTEVDYAGMLLERDGTGDRELATRFIDSALNLARALKMDRLASRAEALKSRQREPSQTIIGRPTEGAPRQTSELDLSTAGEELELNAAGPGMSASAGVPGHADARLEQSSLEEDNVFKREGDYWTIVFGKKITRLRHVKGLSMIAWLLRHPHREFLAWTLDRLASGCDMAPDNVRPGAEFDPELPGRAGTCDSGPLLDTQARANYSRRLKELQEDLDEAKSFNDIGRTSAIEEEIGFITSELCRGIGLGGRARKWPSETERARVNVTNSVRAVLAKLRRENPALGRYLANTIKTGRFCTFDPDPSFPAEWMV